MNCCLGCLLGLILWPLLIAALFGKPEHDDEEKVAITTILMD